MKHKVVIEVETEKQAKALAPLLRKLAAFPGASFERYLVADKAADSLRSAESVVWVTEARP